MRGVRTAQLVFVIATQLCVARSAWPIQTTTGGRQVDLDMTLSVREVVEENRATTHERTLEQLRVRAAVALAPWLRFDSTTLGINGGPTLKSDRTGLYSWDHTFQDISPAVDFEEAYFDVFLPSIDLRIGKQKVAWGKLDRTQPNDLINPLIYSDPFLDDEAERKIGVPALQASYYLPTASLVLPESRLTAVWVPKYIPYRFPLASCQVQDGGSQCAVERWFPPAGVPPTAFVLPLPAGSPIPSLTVPLGFRTENASPPAWRFENSEIGLRYSALVRDVDLALYYFHGFDAQPAFRLSAKAFGQPDTTPPLYVAPGTLFGVTTLSPAFHQIDSWGADLAYALGRFSVRGEGAFIRGRPFSRDLRTLLEDSGPIAGSIQQALGELAMGKGSADVQLPESFAVRDSVEWGVGGDYVYEEYLLLLQVNQTDVLHNDANLLIKNVDTRLLANLRRSFLSDTVRTQLVAIHAIESDYTILRPKLFYQFTDHIGGELGYLFIAGRAHSVGGQFRRNDEGWVRAEYKL
ncbi:MAG: DUF1302 family protein [Candidatus Binatia bacterium]